MNKINLCLKVDVDTDRGTRIGVLNLLNLFKELNIPIPATFLFSLGPDNTGRAIKRIFRRGFLSKVRRTSVVSTYGLRTLLNGVLLPGPHIGRRNEALMRSVHEAGYEVGIHCYDHIRWQDGLAKMSPAEVFAEFSKAQEEFKRIFGKNTKTAGAAGWQANAFSLAAYDNAQLLYASDVRGTHAFFPQFAGYTYKTLQIPTNLPTLDELLGLPEFSENTLIDYYLSLLAQQTYNVLTIHAEIEGMAKLDWFKEFLQKALQHGVNFMRLDALASQLLKDRRAIPVHEVITGEIPGRSGTLAIQGKKQEILKAV